LQCDIMIPGSHPRTMVYCLFDGKINTWNTSRGPFALTKFDNYVKSCQVQVRTYHVQKKINLLNNIIKTHCISAIPTWNLTNETPPPHTSPSELTRPVSVELPRSIRSDQPTKPFPNSKSARQRWPQHTEAEPYRG
jgi:hypothetical protein